MPIEEGWWGDCGQYEVKNMWEVGFLYHTTWMNMYSDVG
jgi:hypothetical protein